MDVEKARIVCHRGLHDVDDNISRPMENSLSAYEGAWKYFTSCECDITVSSDGILFLCHDETYKRVADLSISPSFVDKPVCELLAEEIEQIRLLDGSKPARLSEVLERAKEFQLKDENEGKKKLVVEVKSDNASEQVVQALCEFLLDRTDLLEHIPVIMSFDLTIMSKLAKWRLEQVSASQSLKDIKLMILTEAPAHWKLENNTIRADVRSPSFVSDSFDIVEKAKLDGIYLEFQNEMITTPLLQQNLLELSKETTVGVWTYKYQPDGLVTLPTLCKFGVTYINSDLPAEQLMAYQIFEDKVEPISCFDSLWLFCIYGRT